MSGRKLHSLVLLFVLSSVFLAGCGDDSGRAREPVLDYSNYTDLSLASMAFNAGTLSPAFDPGFPGPYSLSVDSDVASIEITAAPKEDNVRLEIATVRPKLDENGDQEYDENGAPLFENSAEANIIDPGEVDIKTLREGENLIEFRLAPLNSNTSLTYMVNVHRVNSNAKLVRVLVANEGHVATTAEPVGWVDLEPEFDPAVADYTASVPYNGCMISVSARTNERHTTIDINGESASSLEFVPLNMAEGSNVVTLESEAENGTSETYTITLTRAAGTDAEYLADATLGDLLIEGGTVSREYRCLISAYSARINNSVDGVTITASPSVAGATMRFGTVVRENGVLIGIEDPVELTAGEPFVFDMEEVATYDQAIEVTANDGETIKFYNLILTKGSTNRVAVETAEELQSALLNAEPGDEILLAPVFYEGLASLETSGHEQAHFYSAASGADDNPIIVRSAVSGYTPVLLGSEYESGEVLRITGDYWIVRDLQLVGARDGLVLDNANNNRFDGISITGMGERAVKIVNGSSNNVISRSAISNTGLASRDMLPLPAEAVVIGSNASDWLSAPDGTENPAADNNALWGNVFGPNIRAEVVDIREGTTGNKLVYSVVDTRGITEGAENNSAVVIKGNDVNISYNDFANESGEQLAQLITAQATTAGWISQNWGENASVYQNSANLGGAEIPLANSTDVIDLNVAENFRDDGVEPTYTGTGIDTTFPVPVYQLQTDVTDALCLAEERPFPTREEAIEQERSAYPYVFNETCSSDSAQKWKMLNAGEGYVFLATVDDNSRILVPSTPAFTSSSTGYSNVITLDPEVDLGGLGILNPTEGFYLRWQPVFATENSVAFYNKGDWYKRYVLAGNPDVGDRARVALYVGSSLQRFVMVEQ